MKYLIPLLLILPLSSNAQEVFPDFDGDGYADYVYGEGYTQSDVDNCTFTYNPSQIDADGDGYGAPCDDTEETPDVRQMLIDYQNQIAQMEERYNNLLEESGSADIERLNQRITLLEASLENYKSGYARLRTRYNSLVRRWNSLLRRIRG